MTTQETITEATPTTETNPADNQTPSPDPTTPTPQTQQNSADPAPNGDPAPAADPAPAPDPAPEPAHTIEDEALRAFVGEKSMEDLARELQGAQKLIGKKQVIPDENTSDPDRERFYNELGKPTSHDGYKVELPEGTPPEVASDIEAFRAAAYGMNLTQEQFEGSVGYVLQQNEELAGQVAQLEEAGQKTWNTAVEKVSGSDFGTPNCQVTRAMRNLFGDQTSVTIQKALAVSPIVDEKNAEQLTTFLNGLKSFGGQLRQGTDGAMSDATGNVTASEAQSEKDGLLGDPANSQALRDWQSPVSKRLEELNKIIQRG